MAKKTTTKIYAVKNPNEIKITVVPISKKAHKTFNMKSRRKIMESAQLSPMMPRKYTAQQRVELRRFEKELLEGVK